MKYLTYRDIKEGLNNLTDEQLDMTVTIYDASSGEYIPVSAAIISNDDDILSYDNHPVLEINGEDDETS